MNCLPGKRIIMYLCQKRVHRLISNRNNRYLRSAPVSYVPWPFTESAATVNSGGCSLHLRSDGARRAAMPAFYTNIPAFTIICHVMVPVSRTGRHTPLYFL